MATTFSSLITDTIGLLRGYTRNQDQFAAITASLTNVATTFTISNPSLGSAGLAEIGDELIYVDNVDATTGIVTVAPGGRGVEGTTAAAYASGQRIVFSPMFPRSVIGNAINDIINTLDQTLYVPAITTFSMSPIGVPSALPAGCSGVIYADYQDLVSLRWIPVNRWTYDPIANTIDLDGVPVARTVRVTYMPHTVPFAAPGDLYSTTLLPTTAVDVLKYGAAMRLLSTMDPAMLSNQSASANAIDSQGANIGKGANTFKYIYQIYQQRVNDERAKIQQSWPGRMVRGR